MPVAIGTEKQICRIVSSGRSVYILNDFLARVDGKIVTDYDCGHCGETGDRWCPHQEDMFEALGIEMTK